VTYPDAIRVSRDYKERSVRCILRNQGDWVNMKLFRIAMAAMIVTSIPAFAQWLKLSTPGIPRTADGKPNLTALAPKLPDGKPDLSGIWNPNPKYLLNLAADLKPEDVLMQPWAEKIFTERKAGLHAKEEPDANCLPQGVPKLDAAPVPWKIIQLPGEVVVLYEAFTQYRQIFLDGRPLPTDPNPNWLGYSVGHYDGDTLVVETSGFNGKAWLDQAGHPATEALHVTERYRRKDFGHLQIQITIDDPKAYNKPWTVIEDPTLMVDTELLEFICNENERDVKHIK
jgi:hypothetical protein